jgi:predicted secreted protein
MKMRPWLLIPALLAVSPAYADQTDVGAPTVLHLTQSAERRITRDLLHVDMRAEGKGADPKAVEAGINRLMAKALAEAKQVPGIEVSNGGYNVYRDASSSEWTGSQSLFLGGTDSGALLSLAGTLQAGGMVMSNLGYEVAPATVRGAESVLTVEALSGLGQRAAAIAQQLHVSVLGYRNLTVGNAETSGGPMPRFAATATASPMSAPVAAPGEGTVRVTVSADILLGTKKP